MVMSTTRRERLRESTVGEIKALARRQLVASGPHGVSLRAIARDMGMSTPGLYRYFASHEDLLSALITDVYTELAEHLEAARDAQPGATPGARLCITSRAFRQWALAHPSDFALVFGSPIPGLDVPAEAPIEAGRRFGDVFFSIMAELWMRTPFPVPAEQDLEPALAQQLALYQSHFGAGLPLPALQVFLSCWVRLYGLVCMEVFGHLDFAVADGEPMFEAELRDLAVRLGVPQDYHPPHH